MTKFDFTTATRQELSVVWRAIAEEMGDDRFFTTKELDHLPRILDEQEQVLAFSSGLHKGNTWLIVLTDQRILFLDKGLIYGLKTSSIELERVNNFDYQKGIMFGNLSIGSNAEIYEITNVWKKTIEPFTKKLRQAMKSKLDGIELYAPGTESLFEPKEGPPEIRTEEAQSQIRYDFEPKPTQDEIRDEAPESQEDPVQIASYERMKRAGLV